MNLFFTNVCRYIRICCKISLKVLESAYTISGFIIMRGSCKTFTYFTAGCFYLQYERKYVEIIFRPGSTFISLIVISDTSKEVIWEWTIVRIGALNCINFPPIQEIMTDDSWTNGVIGKLHFQYTLETPQHMGRVEKLTDKGIERVALKIYIQ